MPTKNPRLNIVIDPGLYEQIELRAERMGVSMSLVARDLIREALELEEDAALAEIAAERNSNYGDSSLSHEDGWD